jgi:hypothetical protein
MTIHNELLDELLAGQDPSSVMRRDDLLGEKKALASNNSYCLLELLGSFSSPDSRASERSSLAAGSKRAGACRSSAAR